MSTETIVELHGGTRGTGGTNLITQGNSGSPTGEFSGHPGNRTGGPVATLTQAPPRKLTTPKIERPGFSTHDDWFLIGRRKMRPGLYWHDAGDDDKPPEDSWICTPIHADATTANMSGESWGLLLRFVDPRGHWHDWAMPMSLLKGSGEELRGELLNLGVRINPRRKTLLNDWLMQQYPRRRVIAASVTGWHTPDGSQPVFVLPTRTIGDGDVRFQSEHAAHNDFREAGSLEGWRENLAGLCRGNPVLLLAVSTAFAGPLLQLARKQDNGGAGVHLLGDSSRGKTTALQAAASVWGPPAFVRTWRATANGLEATAAALNDTLLVLDEISECDPREIGSIVYALANGHGKQRAQRTGSARASARWRLLVLSSGERTLGAHMSEAGQRVKAGQEARLLDVPATDRRHGAFDNLHDRPDGRALADTIKQAAATHYGHAGPAFVEKLRSSADDLRNIYATIQDLPMFKAKDGLQARAAGVFALIGMAGELASQYGLTGWAEGEALDAAMEGFDRWRANRGEGQTESRQILDAIEEFLARHGESRFESLTQVGPLPVRDRSGYWRDGPNGRVYLFHSAALREAAFGHDLRRILGALTEAGWIVDHDHGKRTKKTKVAGRTVNLYAIRPGEL